MTNIKNLEIRGLRGGPKNHFHERALLKNKYTHVNPTFLVIIQEEREEKEEEDEEDEDEDEDTANQITVEQGVVTVVEVIIHPPPSGIQDTKL